MGTPTVTQRGMPTVTRVVPTVTTGRITATIRPRQHSSHLRLLPPLPLGPRLALALAQRAEAWACGGLSWPLALSSSALLLLAPRPLAAQELELRGQGQQQQGQG